MLRSGAGRREEGRGSGVRGEGEIDKKSQGEPDGTWPWKVLQEGTGEVGRS